jgi:hypothetical protein
LSTGESALPSPQIDSSDAPAAENPSHAPRSTPRGERVASICRDAPRPDISCGPRRARRVKSAARFLARRERSHAQARPFFTGEASMASTCLLTRLSTVAAVLADLVQGSSDRPVYVVSIL